MKRIIILFVVCFCTPCFCGVFSTKGHEKSNGLNIELHYPDDWIAAEGIRPHVVQKFSKDNNECVLLITSIREPLTQKEWAIEFQSMPKLYYETLLGEGRNVSVSRTKYEGQEGILLRAQGVQQRAGMTLYSNSLVHMFGYKDSFIMLLCMSAATTRQEAEQNFVKNETDFMLFGNGLVLLDKYME